MCAPLPSHTVHVHRHPHMYALGCGAIFFQRVPVMLVGQMTAVVIPRPAIALVKCCLLEMTVEGVRWVWLKMVALLL